MKQHQLRAFLALAEQGSLVKASTRLNKTTAAISKTIRELEDDFQVKLFHRTPQGMSLAAGGKILLPRAQAMLAEMIRADEELRTLRGEQQGRLRIGLTPAVSVLIAPEAIERFIIQMPSIRLEVFEYQRDQMPSRLDDGTLDIALYAVPSFITRNADPGGSLLYSTELALAVRNDGALADVQALADLQDALWIHTDPSGAQEAFIAATFTQQQIAPPPRTLLCTSSVLGVTLALKMNAVALIARPIAESIPLLSILPLLPESPTLRVYSMVRQSESFSEVVKTFLDITTRSSLDGKVLAAM
jgi:LysR family transcriptional regulator of abg operon